MQVISYRCVSNRNANYFQVALYEARARKRDGAQTYRFIEGIGCIYGRARQAIDRAHREAKLRGIPCGTDVRHNSLV